MMRKEEHDLKELYDEIEREEEERRMEEVRSLREALEEERRIRELLELMLRQPGKNLSDMVQRVQGR
jgi:rubrerythrin